MIFLNWRSKVIWFSIALVAMVALNQNCSRVSLTEAHKSTELFLQSKGDLCLNNSLAEYSLESVYAVNVNLILTNGLIDIDTDGDGISDKNEALYGFDPKLRRSNGLFLDKICLDISGGNQCESLAQNCSTDDVGFGLTGCDLEALKLDQIPIGHRGLDSDKDGILDFVEVMRGLIAGRKDSLDDPDHDMILNFEEISSGLNPLFFDSDAILKNRIVATVDKIEDSDSSSCIGEKWKVDIQRVPLVNMEAYQEPNLSSQHKIDFSHQKNENVVVIILILKPKVGGGNYKIYSKVHKLNYLNIDLPLSMEEFNDIGEVPQ